MLVFAERPTKLASLAQGLFKMDDSPDTLSIPQNASGPVSISSKKERPRHQVINLASTERVRAWGDRPLILEEYVSLGHLTRMLGFLGPKASQSWPINKRRQTRTVICLTRPAEACSVVLPERHTERNKVYLFFYHRDQVTTATSSTSFSRTKYQLTLPWLV